MHKQRAFFKAESGGRLPRFRQLRGLWRVVYSETVVVYFAQAAFAQFALQGLGSVLHQGQGLGHHIVAGCVGLLQPGVPTRRIGLFLPESGVVAPVRPPSVVRPIEVGTIST